jgi:hypothetical protein
LKGSDVVEARATQILIYSDMGMCQANALLLAEGTAQLVGN